jgi:hypothetical protein
MLCKMRIHTLGRRLLFRKLQVPVGQGLADYSVAKLYSSDYGKKVVDREGFVEMLR